MKIPKNDTRYGGGGGQKSKTFALIAQNFPNLATTATTTTNPNAPTTTTTTTDPNAPTTTTTTTDPNAPTTTATCSDTCFQISWKGDNYCDDANNNCGCEWDGGDCCGSNVNTAYCSSCQCLDPNADPGVDSFTTSACDNPSWIGDGMCDDETNKEICDWDGGDCCGSNTNTQYCSSCECLDPNAAASRKKRNVFRLSDITDSNEKTTVLSPRKKRNINLQNNDGLSGKILLVKKYIFHHMFKNCLFCI